MVLGIAPTDRAHVPGLLDGSLEKPGGPTIRHTEPIAFALAIGVTAAILGAFHVAVGDPAPEAFGRALIVTGLAAIAITLFDR
jgi:hypothetical protein